MKRLGLLALAVSLSSCFQVGPLAGPYRCDAVDGGTASCGEGLTCDDGVCCSATGEPRCRALVLPSGACASPTGSKKTYVLDADRDGFPVVPSPQTTREYCAKPMSDPYMLDTGGPYDCDDSAAQAHPGGTESCDGLDNDCEGGVDEGFTVSTFFADQDGDGYGDAAKTLTACKQPPKHAATATDCAPLDATRFPGARERCNALDDDCNGSADDGFVESVGKDCNTKRPGVCEPGKFVCLGGGTLSCQELVSESPDRCDGLDNDCDGTIDERPSCGGPASLFSSPGVSVKAFRLTTTSAPVLMDNCPSLLPNDGAASTWAEPLWSASGATARFRVLSVQAPKNETWDLSRAGTALHFSFTYRLLNWADAGVKIDGKDQLWDDMSQPSVYFCTADGGFNRYAYGDLGLPGQKGPINLTLSSGDAGAQVIPNNGSFDGTRGWNIGAGSGADLTQVARVDFVVGPQLQPGGMRSTQTEITFGLDAGF